MNRKEANKIIDKHSAAFGALPREAIEAIEYLINAEHCEDTINRAELLKAIDTWDKFGVDDTNSLFRLDNLSLPHYVPYIHYDDVIKCINGMSSVTPKQKIGHWINYQKNRWIYAQCSECGTVHDTQTNYCPNCGAKMAESEVSG